MSESQFRAELYLHAEALQTEIDGVRATALHLSRLAKEYDDENLAIVASKLLSRHSRLYDRFTGLVAVLRESSDAPNRGARTTSAPSRAQASVRVSAKRR